MALHRKWERLLGLAPDIAVVPEAASPEILRRKAPSFSYTDCEWEGWYEHKGLGVFTFGAWSIRRHSSHTREQSVFLPLEVCGAHHFNMLAVWAFTPGTPPRAVPNSASIRAAVAYYRPFLLAAPSVVAGDFNSSTCWDRPGRLTNHAETVSNLGNLGLSSAYHRLVGCSPGAEPDPTLFQQRKLAAGFHIDYCFVPDAWLGTSSSATVGAPEQWLADSDHVPLVIDLDLESWAAVTAAHTT